MKDKSYSISHSLWMIFLLIWIVMGCTTIHPVMVADKSSVDRDTFSNERFDRVLERFVDQRGLVNYSELQNDPDDLEAYYRLIATYSPDSHPDLFPDEKHKLAYWINAYNVGAIKTVLTYYPIDSVLDVKTPALLFFLSDKAGFFFFQRLTFGGKTTSLYYLENRIIRKRFNDPRIHFAVNCASLGCPRLPRQPFTGDALDPQLDHETRLFLAEERNFKIDHKEKAIYLSSIFQWYEKDFTNWYRRKNPGRPASLLSYIDLYLTTDKSDELGKIADSYDVRFVPYDWSLNDQKILN